MKPVLAVILLPTVLMLLNHVWQANAFVKTVAYIKKFEYQTHSPTFNVSYRINHPKSVTNQSLDIFVDIKRKVKDLRLLFLYHSVTLNGSIPVIKRPIDMCFFMRNPRSDRLVKSFYDYVRVHTNIPLKCPIAPGSYMIHGVRPSDAPLPSFLPNVDFVLELIYYSEARAEKLMEYRVYGKLVRLYDNMFK
uniref:MD-2-related lipid-recognition domain-containing protein n=1 Tax=Anopheles christyi TaxID=43041 RepID=A0A182JW76_9DIPT